MSGPPMSAPPFGPAAQPAARRGVAVPLLASLLALFVLLTGVMTALFLARSSDYTKAKHTIAARNTTIRTDEAQLKQLKDDLQDKQDELDKAQQDLKGSQNQADELKHEKQVIANCLNLLGEATAASERGDKATAQAKVDQAKPVCDEAERYLGT